MRINIYIYIYTKFVYLGTEKRTIWA